MRRLFASILLLSALGACHKAEEPSAQASSAASTAAAPSAAPSAPAATATGTARKVSIDNDLITYEYAYPAVAAAIPALKALLDADIADRKAELEAEARTGRKDAKEGGFEFRPFGYWLDWKVVTDLPGWLSLSTEVDTFEGGAHPSHGFDALLWDKAAGQRRKPVDLFVSTKQLSGAIRAEFCRQIDKQRAEKRGEPVNRGSEELFNDCIDPLDSTLILGSSNHQTFDRIGVLVAPYDAGPYAEGSYEATLPVTPAILALVKPEYRASFSVKH
jgi:hypothetical protein